MNGKTFASSRITTLNRRPSGSLSIGQSPVGKIRSPTSDKPIKHGWGLNINVILLNLHSFAFVSHCCSTPSPHKYSFTCVISGSPTSYINIINNTTIKNYYHQQHKLDNIIFQTIHCIFRLTNTKAFFKTSKQKTRRTLPRQTNGENEQLSCCKMKRK